jgi:hypothetical protein
MLLLLLHGGRTSKPNIFVFAIYCYNNINECYQQKKGRETEDSFIAVYLEEGIESVCEFYEQQGQSKKS